MCFQNTKFKKNTYKKDQNTTVRPTNNQSYCDKCSARCAAGLMSYLWRVEPCIYIATQKAKVMIHLSKPFVFKPFVFLPQARSILALSPPAPPSPPTPQHARQFSRVRNLLVRPVLPGVLRHPFVCLLFPSCRSCNLSPRPHVHPVPSFE